VATPLAAPYGIEDLGVFGRKSQKFQMTVDQCLSARPVRNPQTQARDLPDDRLELTLACLKPWPIRIFCKRDRRMFPRRFELDLLGASLWREIDGSRTVNELIGYLVRTHGLPPRQAQDSMVSFLQMLMARGLVGLVLTA